MTLPGPAARGALPAGIGRRAKAIRRLESTRNGHAHSFRLAGWPRSRRPLGRAPLFCALVIPGVLFCRFCGSSPGRLGRPLPNTSRSDASQASRRCHEGRICSLSQERRGICRAPSQ